MEIPKVVVLVHGWGGNRQDSWLTRTHQYLLSNGVDSRLPDLPDAEHPDPWAWVPALRDEMNHAMRTAGGAEGVVVVTHSLGGITWLRLGADSISHMAREAILVAPPYVNPHLLPDGAPSSVKAFFEEEFDRTSARCSAGRTTIIAGQNDCYAGSDQILAVAKLFDVDELYELPGGEHVSPGAGGYGRWQWLEKYLLGQVGMPPMNRHGSPAKKIQI